MINAIGYYSNPESLTLTGLTGLTNTSVTFTFTFDTPSNPDRANTQRFHTMDGVTLTANAIPEPSSTALIGLAGLGFIIRRRR